MSKFVKVIETNVYWVNTLSNDLETSIEVAEKWYEEGALLSSDSSVVINPDLHMELGIIGAVISDRDGGVEFYDEDEIEEDELSEMRLSLL